jgi:hypothetical protein
MPLIYRANRFEYTPSVNPVTHQSGAINWRYHCSDFAVTPIMLPLSRDPQPRAFNWRYQRAMEA